MKKILILLATLCLVACSSSTSTSTEATATAEAEETTVAESTATPEAEEEVVTSGAYNFINETGETVTELYVYQTGTSENGDNLAEGGLANGESVGLNVEVTEEEAEGFALTVEFVTESGNAPTPFTTLHLEEANIALLSTDAIAGSTNNQSFSFPVGE